MGPPTQKSDVETWATLVASSESMQLSLDTRVGKRAGVTACERRVVEPLQRWFRHWP
jgi:hypothetical protein